MNNLAIDCSYMTHNRQYITPVGCTEHDIGIFNLGIVIWNNHIQENLW